MWNVEGTAVKIVDDSGPDKDTIFVDKLGRLKREYPPTKDNSLTTLANRSEIPSFMAALGELLGYKVTKID